MSENTNASGTEPEKVPATPAQEENKNNGQQPEENVIDYKSENEKLVERLNKAEHTIVNLKKENKTSAKRLDDDDDESDQSRNSIDAESLLAAVDERIAKSKEESALSIVEEELKKLSSNPDKVAYIKTIYNNKIVKSGLTREQIISDLKSAQAIADAPLLQARAEEINIANNNKTTVNMSGSGGKFGSDSNSGNQLNDAEINLLKAFGADPSKVSKN